MAWVLQSQKKCILSRHKIVTTWGVLWHYVTTIYAKVQEQTWIKAI